MKLKLKQDLGLTTGVGFITGCIIGSGIFISPTPVLAGAGESVGIALCIWLGTGILTIFGSLSYIELSLRIRKSGGVYIFLHEGLGSHVGFAYLWTDLFVLRPLAVAVTMQATGRYILRPIFLDCPKLSPKIAEDLLGLLLLYVCLIINSLSMKYTKFMINSITVCKVGALLLIIVGGIIQLGEGKTSHFHEPFKVDEIDMKKLIFAFYTAVYAFQGGNNITGLFEEFENPTRSLIAATVIGHLIPILTYLMANIAYYAVLTKEEILSGVTVAVVFGERRLGYFKWLILPCVAISTAGIVLSNLIASSRATFVAARNGMFPKIFSLLSLKRRAPIPALLVLVIITTVVGLCVDLLSLLKIYSFLRTMFDSVSLFGILRIRQKYNPEGVLKLPLIIPIVYVTVLLFFAVNTLIYSPEVIQFSAAAIGTAVLAKIILFMGNDSTSRSGKLLANFAASLEKTTCRLLVCGRTEMEIDEF